MPLNFGFSGCEKKFWNCQTCIGCERRSSLKHDLLSNNLPVHVATSLLSLNFCVTEEDDPLRNHGRYDPAFPVFACSLAAGIATIVRLVHVLDSNVRLSDRQRGETRKEEKVTDR